MDKIALIKDLEAAQSRIAELEAALAPFADAAAHIPEEAEMLDVDYMLDGEAGCEPVAFEGIAFHRARALLEEES